MTCRTKKEQKHYQKLWYIAFKKHSATKIEKECAIKELLKFHRIPLTKEQLKLNKNIRSQKYRNQKRLLLSKYVGDKCYFCKYTSRLICHEKNGDKHQDLHSMGRRQLEEYISNNEDKYVRICFKCHKAVHWCLKFLRLKWKDIEKIQILMGT
jgi:hypothetical protein